MSPFPRPLPRRVSELIQRSERVSTDRPRGKMYADRKALYPETITAPLISLRSRCHWSRSRYRGGLWPGLARRMSTAAFLSTRKLKPFSRLLANSSSPARSPLTPPIVYFFFPFIFVLSIAPPLFLEESAADRNRSTWSFSWWLSSRSNAVSLIQFPRKMF